MNFYQTIYKKIYGDFNIWTDVKCDVNKIDLQGWGGDHQIFQQINNKFDKHIFVDVGVWKGQSSINLAKNIKQNNLNAVVISIDTFLGSGTTAIACKNLKRNFKGCEISKEYYDKILEIL